MSEEERYKTEGRSQRSLSTERDSRSSRTAAWILQSVNPKAPLRARECTVKEKTKEHVTKLEDSVCVSQTRENDLPTRNEIEHVESSSDEHKAGAMNSDSEQPDDEHSVHELEPNQLFCSSGESNQSVQAESIVMSNGASSMSRSVRSFKQQASSCKSEHAQRKSPKTVTVVDTALKPNEGTVRTRAGRLVKPVRRLLECMSMILTETGQKDPLAELLKVLSNIIEG